MLYEASCVLEGGAMMGVYTAGILDVLIENDIYFSHVVGVSAGAANAINYAGGMHGRTVNCMAVEDRKIQFFGLGTLLRRHVFYDFDLCFFEFADKYIPFDYESFNASPVECEAVVTDVNTGRAVYLPCTKKDKEMVAVARASASMPFFSKIYKCQGYDCLDGGVADSVPIVRAKSYGNEKIIIVRTKPKGFRREAPGRLSRLMIKIKYGRYPNFVKAMLNRYSAYNKVAEECEQLEAEGKAFVFYPESVLVRRMEKDREKLMAAYDAGRRDATAQLSALKAYLSS